MRAVRCAGDGRVELVEVAEPANSGVRVNVVAAGICGTDLHAVHGPQPPSILLGHELSGTLDDGTPVAIDPCIPCEKCPDCLSGHYNVCRGGPTGTPADIYIGFQSIDGGMADQIVVPERCLVPLPQGLDLSVACLIEPLAVALHCLHLAGAEHGKRVAVVGGGTLGLCTVAGAVSLGCEAGLAARYHHQVAAGASLGATAISGEYDVVVDAAGGETSASEAVGHVRPGGTVAFVAAYYGPVPVSGIELLLKEVHTVTSLATGVHQGVRDVDAAADLLAGKPEIADALITHRFSLDDVEEAFRVAADRSEGAIKVVVEP